MNVYVLSRGEMGEGPTVISVHTSEYSAQVAAEQVMMLEDLGQWQRESNTCWTSEREFLTIQVYKLKE